ncbi:MAG: N-acetylmuramoyl-L-alanine amidase [Blautia sp.]|nr:N-acetylmuramoyl-L-alanine amidase [Blautia sp.]
MIFLRNKTLFILTAACLLSPPLHICSAQEGIPAESQQYQEEGTLSPPDYMSPEPQPYEEEGTLSPPGSHAEEGTLGAPSGNSTSIFSQAGQSEPVKEIYLDDSLPFAQYSVIHTGAAKLYTSDVCGHTICINAGHGTSGGDSAQTLCHPDGSPKVTGGTTEAGATYAMAVSYGCTMIDGTPESSVTLSLALILRDLLLQNGYNVLMIREGADIQLDNVARTVLANNYADVHLALHYDSTASDKGFFYLGVPDVASYRAMEPVASVWPLHEELGQHLVSGIQQEGLPIYGGGRMEMDLTQTSYSTIPSLDVEVGDTASDHSAAYQTRIARGILAGLNSFFGVE